MPSPFRRGLTIVALCIAGVLSAVTLTSAQVRKASASPSAVAIVDLAQISAALAEAKALHDRLKLQADASQKDLDTLKADLKKAGDDLDLLKDKKGTPEYLRAFVKRYEIESNLKARGELAQRLLDISEGENMRTLYEKILKAVDQIGKDQGYDLILWDDRAIKAPEGTRTGAEIWSAIRDRRILFASDRVNITEQVITMMDNEYKAGKK
jgi:Skp family chaperone for outer membrane proteins